jgi:hypothetical protein
VTPEPDIEKMINEEFEGVSEEQKGQSGDGAPKAATEFSVLDEDKYRLCVPAIGAVFEIDRLRRDRGELIGELRVRCSLFGVRTIDGNLSVAEFNVSSARSRSERARLLGELADAPEIQWLWPLEEFSQKVLQADRNGRPGVDLRSIPPPAVDDDLKVAGLHLLRRHPAMIFGDGSSCKSYLALYLAGLLAEREMRIALFDWELAGEDHRVRLERLFWDGMPQITYVRCERPLVYEVDRLRRIVREMGIEYAVFDSVAFACDGPPEAAEVAGGYFRAVRQIGIGSLHIAHITKGGDDQRPFGSTFWYNGARSVWFAQAVSSNPNSDTLHLGLFNRKANLAKIQPPLGFRVSFEEERTTFHPADVADNADLAEKMSVKQRMAAILRHRALTAEEIAEAIEADIETVKRTARRDNDLFIRLPDNRYGLRLPAES